MITLPMIWKNILTFLGIAKDPPKGQEKGHEFTFEYNDKDGINLNFVVANKISNLVVTDSSLNVTGTQTARIDFLNSCAAKVWRLKKRIVSRAAGYGKVCLFPYTDDGLTIKFDIISQGNVIVLADNGERPTDVAVLADKTFVKTVLYGKFKRYSLIDNTHIISEFYANLTTGKVIGATPPSVTGWEEMPDFSIANVDRLLFGWVDCPVDPRNNDNFYASKITDGADWIIEDIKKQLEEIAREFDVKKAFVGADETLFKRDPSSGKYTISETGIFKVFNSGGNVDKLFQEFSPAYRDTPLFTRLKETFKLLENHTGLSRGILTDTESMGTYANMSNIKRSVYDTYAFVTDFRANVLCGVKDYIYACNVIAEYFNITPQGVRFEDIDINIDWSSDMIEDSAETFNQFVEGVAQGVIDRAELRQWLTGEDLETAMKKVAEIQGNMPVTEVI